MNSIEEPRISRELSQQRASPGAKEEKAVYMSVLGQLIWHAISLASWLCYEVLVLASKTN